MTGSLAVARPWLCRAAWFTALLLAATAAAANPFVPKADLWEFWTAHDEASTQQVDHAEWQALLDAYLVSDHPSGINRFAYGQVTAADRARLQGYLQALAAVDPRRLARAEQRAYWINLYNALTVNLVLEHYPVKSIRKIHGGLFGLGPWGREITTVAGQDLSLNDVEHRILRPIWRDPRIHYAVNCASLGCPNLAARAYTAANTDQLLDAGARAYVNHPRGARLADGRLTLSSIYDWYQVDFGGDTAGVLAHLQRYARPELAAALAGFDGRIDYAYDWALNEP